MKGKKIKRTMLAVTVLCMGFLIGCGTDKKTEEQQLALRTQGMEQAREGSYEDAIASYNEALELADMHAGSLELDIAAYKASAQYYAGNTEDAIATCSAILDLKESAEIYTTRGLLYREVGNAEAAKADFTKAMSLTSKKNKVMLGRLSYYMEDDTNAKTYLEAASKEGNPEGIYWQAELYREMGNPEYAITLYQSYLDGEEVTHQEAYEQGGGLSAGNRVITLVHWTPCRREFPWETADACRNCWHRRSQCMNIKGILQLLFRKWKPIWKAIRMMWMHRENIPS